MPCRWDQCDVRPGLGVHPALWADDAGRGTHQEAPATRYLSCDCHMTSHDIMMCALCAAGWCWDKKEKGDLRYRTVSGTSSSVGLPDCRQAERFCGVCVCVCVQVLSKFLDLKDSSFSIQRIAVQGIDLGRRVGEWFGPNTIAHVLR